MLFLSHQQCVSVSFLWRAQTCRWRVVPPHPVLNQLRHCHLVREALQRVLPLQLLQLRWCVLVEELIDGEEATADTDVDLVLVYFDADALASELVDAFTLTHEHDLQLLSVWVVVDVLSHSFVNLVLLHWDVYRDTRLQIDNVVA